MDGWETLDDRYLKRWKADLKLREKILQRENIPFYWPKRFVGVKELTPNQKGVAGMTWQYRLRATTDEVYLWGSMHNGS